MTEKKPYDVSMDRIESKPFEIAQENDSDLCSDDSEEQSSKVPPTTSIMSQGDKKSMISQGGHN